jgi:hypothetical protein
VDRAHRRRQRRVRAAAVEQLRELAARLEQVSLDSVAEVLVLLE